MSFKIRAAAVTIATSLVAMPLALSGTALAQDNEPEISDVTNGPAINSGVRGGSICGVTWNDVNEDGKRQAGEGPLAGRQIQLQDSIRYANSDADGVYCFDDLEPGAYTLFSYRGPGDPMVLTQGGGDSKFEWVTDVSQPIKVGKGEQVKGVDAGFKIMKADLKAVEIVINNGHATGENTFHVGDIIEIYGALTANGNAPQSLGGTLTLPEGLRILAPLGGLAPGYVVEGQQVTLPVGFKRPLGVVDLIGAKVLVEKEFKAGEIKFEARSHGDTEADLTNNVLTRKIDVLAVVPLPDAPNRTAPEIKKVVALANTGTSPVGLGAAGLGAMTIGGLAVYAARRRSA